MASYKNVDELIKKSVSWEQQLKDLYEVAELGLKDPEAKKIASMLKGNLEKKLEVLRHVDVEKFGTTEWLKFVPMYRDEDIVPKKAITRDSSAETVFKQLLSFEIKLKDFYKAVYNALHSESLKELLDSLIVFKEEQIEQIRRFMKQYNLV